MQVPDVKTDAEGAPPEAAGTENPASAQKQKNWKVAVYVNILDILSVNTKENKFEANFFIRLMWSEHISTADKADRFTSDCKFDPFYYDNEPMENDSKPNGVCHLLRVG